MVNHNVTQGCPPSTQIISEIALPPQKYGGNGYWLVALSIRLNTNALIHQFSSEEKTCLKLPTESWRPGWIRQRVSPDLVVTLCLKVRWMTLTPARALYWDLLRGIALEQGRI